MLETYSLIKICNILQKSTSYDLQLLEKCLTGLNSFWLNVMPLKQISCLPGASRWRTSMLLVEDEVQWGTILIFGFNFRGKPTFVFLGGYLTKNITVGCATGTIVANKKKTIIDLPIIENRDLVVIIEVRLFLWGKVAATPPPASSRRAPFLPITIAVWY